jgi:hypothetical protein
MLAPASRFSKIADTGMRVPFKTHAPLTLPGTLSTAGHCDQSRVAMVAAYLCRGVHTIFSRGGNARLQQKCVGSALKLFHRPMVAEASRPRLAQGRVPRPGTDPRAKVRR